MLTPCIAMTALNEKIFGRVVEMASKRQQACPMSQVNSGFWNFDPLL